VLPEYLKSALLLAMFQEAAADPTVYKNPAGALSWLTSAQCCVVVWCRTFDITLRQQAKVELGEATNLVSAWAMLAVHVKQTCTREGKVCCWVLLHIGSNIATKLEASHAEGALVDLGWS
jgi:hypothetical protein